MQFPIHNRLTGAVQFTADINCHDDAPLSGKIGLAVRWAHANNADLRGANLYHADLRGADLRDVNLCGADLRDADLRDANLRDADLRGANLRGANLSGADLSGANLIDANLRDANLCDSAFAVPSLNRKILAAIAAGGKLDMSDWHVCETTHCRAGWTVHVAGAVGRALEFCLGTSTAAALIYRASCPHLKGKIPDFYASTEQALADIEKLAEGEPDVGA